jgi:hypothetical protein
MSFREMAPLVLSLLFLCAAQPNRGPQQGAYVRATSASQTTRSSANADPAVKPNLGDFAWLAGRWQGSWGPRTAQQTWLPPKGDAIVGTFQASENGRTLVIELYSLVQAPDGIELHLRHFTTSLVPWEKSGDIVLHLSSFDPRLSVFENAAGAQPQRQTLTRVDQDTYVSGSEIASGGSDPQIVSITYHRQRDLVASHRR